MAEGKDGSREKKRSEGFVPKKEGGGKRGRKAVKRRGVSRGEASGLRRGRKLAPVFVFTPGGYICHLPGWQFSSRSHPRRLCFWSNMAVGREKVGNLWIVFENKNLGAPKLPGDISNKTGGRTKRTHFSTSDTFVSRRDCV